MSNYLRKAYSAACAAEPTINVAWVLPSAEPLADVNVTVTVALPPAGRFTDEGETAKAPAPGPSETDSGKVSEPPVRLVTVTVVAIAALIAGVTKYAGKI